MNEQLLAQEKKERPPFVWHVSHNPDIQEFVPRADRVRDTKEGPKIFATPDRDLASAFLIEGHHDGWTKIGYYSGFLVVVVCADREEFIHKDRGGFLYKLPSDTFDFDGNKGMGEHEWTSSATVSPLEKECVPSALNEMLDNGVFVYFVDRAMFERINDSDDYGAQILSEIPSENETHGQDVSEIKEVLRSYICTHS